VFQWPPAIETLFKHHFLSMYFWPIQNHVLSIFSNVGNLPTQGDNGHISRGHEIDRHGRYRCRNTGKFDVSVTRIQWKMSWTRIRPKVMGESLNFILLTRAILAFLSPSPTRGFQLVNGFGLACLCHQPWKPPKVHKPNEHLGVAMYLKRGTLRLIWGIFFT